MSRDSLYDVRCLASSADVRDGRHMKAILYAFLAAVFYAINIPASKILLRDVGPTTMAALVLGFVAYGLSIFPYVRAQNTLGAAKTSAYYAVAPFVGAFLSFLMLKESLSWIYLAALVVMVAGAVLVVIDTLVRHHTHPHQHTYTHFHGGCVHTHTITHTHGHDHFMTDVTHTHHHPVAELEHAVAHKPAAK